jgi:hypothetical protein
MNIVGLLFLLITHFLTGRGVLSLFKVKDRLSTIIPLSFIIGVVLFCMIPMVLEMCHIPITASSVTIAICIIVAGSFGPQVTKLDYTIFKQKLRVKVPVYEWVYIAVFIFLMLPSIWRCFYYPPNARDILSGPEPIAEYTVREHTMINSALLVDLTGTNNHQKPPFVSGLQIVYKLLVHPFGSLWLTILALSFLVWIYSLMRRQIHPFLAGIIMLFFICIPDTYGYTYLLLFDYSNMVLFFAGTYYLAVYARKRENNILFFASFLFGLATIIRSETLVLSAMFLPLIIFILYKKQQKLPSIAINAALFMVMPFLFYYIWVGVFLKYYMPGGFNINEQVTHSWQNISFIFTRMGEINEKLLLGNNTLVMYGYFHFLFMLIVVADCIFIRRFSREAVIMLYGIGLVYVGLAVMGYITPLFDLGNTTKRGIFKMFPLMAMYLANSGLLLKLSGAVRAFEFPVAKQETISQPVKADRNKPVGKKKGK